MDPLALKFKLWFKFYYPIWKSSFRWTFEWWSPPLALKFKLKFKLDHPVKCFRWRFEWWSQEFKTRSCKKEYIWFSQSHIFGSRRKQAIFIARKKSKPVNFAQFWRICNVFTKITYFPFCFGIRRKRNCMKFFNSTILSITTALWFTLTCILLS